MALNKQVVDLSFAKGLDTKTDPFRVQIGNFLSLKNTVFGTAGALTKRNGFGKLANLPNNASAYVTTYNNSLTAIGNTIQSYIPQTSSWVEKGIYNSLSLDTLSVIKNNSNQVNVDMAVTESGIGCAVYIEEVTDPVTLTNTSVYKYAILNTITGQNIVSPTEIPVASGDITGMPRVYLLGRHFMIVFNNVIATVNTLQYVSISVLNPTNVSANTTISTQYKPSSNGTIAFEGVVANNNLYLAWNGTDVGGAVRMAYITSTFIQSSALIYAGVEATIMSVCADITQTTPVIYASFWDDTSKDGNTVAASGSTGTLTSVLAPTLWKSGSDNVINITSIARDSKCDVYYQQEEVYAYNTGIRTDVVNTVPVFQSGSIGTDVTFCASGGLASKAFLYNNVAYMLVVYQSTNQSTYFLMAHPGVVVAKLAYSNASGYYEATGGVPSATVVGGVAKISYLIKDLIQPVNKTQGLTAPNGVYAQLGINLASFDFTTKIMTQEIGANLHITGGFLWDYDGYSLTENGFFLYPDYVETDVNAASGNMSAQQYYYAVTYEWSDNQGNIYRSAPSLPVGATVGSASSSVTLSIPNLRLTYKLDNPVKIVIYRWSAAQQTYYQVTSVTNPLLNDTGQPYCVYEDKLADASIIGNNILYTTGGVIEDISPPATDIMTLFQSRLFLVDSEDRNLIWYSKLIIQSTPVEMSDLFTIYVPPTLSAQTSTGDITALSAMDDKLIIFKENAIYYISGVGPDNTGANNQYSEPVFITSTVGCINKNSIVLTPNGLMFQSNKGIWILGRDLSTSYIGASVEAYNGYTVTSAHAIPETNQVRFTLNSNIALMFDYYYAEWGEFYNVAAVSSTIYDDLHTYIDAYGQVLKETPNKYLDNSVPVLMSFTTGWINLAGVQGFERFYQMYALGTYFTPFKLNTQIAYNYNPSPVTMSTITPNNPSPNYGGYSTWGAGPTWGGNSNVFEARVFPSVQKCESFQLIINEQHDPSYGISAGEGLSLTGLSLVIGLKKGYRTSSASRSFG